MLAEVLMLEIDDGVKEGAVRAVVSAAGDLFDENATAKPLLSWQVGRLFAELHLKPKTVWHFTRLAIDVCGLNVVFRNA
jgi:hypothetical protein